VCRTSLSALALLLAAILSAADRYQSSEPHMGTLVTITLYADSPEQAEQGLVAAFGRIKALDSILSDYKPESELSRVCNTGTMLSTELSTVLLHAQRLSQQTGGAFDITSGPLTRLWRDARSQQRLPSPEQLQEALRSTGFRKLELSEDSRHVRCLAAGMRLDAGGIAKGYAADEALTSLARIGIGSALVAVSGDVATSGPPPGRTGWRVRVQNEILSLANAAVSTSGDEFQFIEIDGVRYSHILDPRTGMAVRNGPTVSVIAASGIEADGLATALSVTGPESRPPHSVRKLAGGYIVDVRSSTH
jgi:FAD:protein FMN transferase